MIVFIRLVATSMPLIALPALAAEPAVTQTVLHPETMDAWQANAGRARQP